MGSIQKPYFPQGSSNSFVFTAIIKSGAKTLKDRLIDAVANDPDLPALGSSIARIVKLSSSDDQSIQQLSYYVLSDVSLTQKILRLSNSAAFKAITNKEISSINKAIFLLGFDAVKTSALAILLVDGMPAKHAAHVRIELIHALAASVISRKLAVSFTKDIEEASIAALFKNLGRILLATYEPDLYHSMMALVTQGQHTPAQASMQVLGFSLDTLTEALLEEWNVPSNVIQALSAKPSGALITPRNKQEWMQIAAEFCEKAAPLVLNTNLITEEIELKEKLLNRFGKVFNLTMPVLNELISKATLETRELLVSADLESLDKNNKISQDSTHCEFDIAAEENLINELTINDNEPHNLQITERYACNKPYNASSLLLNGIQKTTEMMASGDYRLDNLINLGLDSLYSAFGFRFITLCLKDSKINSFRARSSLGKKNLEYQKGFNFSTVPTNDLFHLAMQRNIDIVIASAFTPRIRKLMPLWHTTLLPDACSILVLPLVVNKKPIGLIYADRETESPEGITHDEAKLVRILKGQILIALNSK
ncbi:HDOD domain-containing protein [Nitrosomonas ureae]|uniref:HDOD domain-containing protein n=1 Tax=Nitrosomonas ureae TaxID=44577 RepID=A0A1H5X343_9PROT|nr:HDOD domain-containing protein [Nitrosomonas ureae]SEG05747.1 HDOD domain-containing protein [Nitrosomonas ureae]